MDLKKELTEVQKAVNDVLNKIKFEFCPPGQSKPLREYIKKLKQEYGILPKCPPTLREYLQRYKDNELMSFHATVYMNATKNILTPQKIYFYNEENFCRIFNEKLLDTLYVKEEIKLNALDYDLVLEEVIK